MDGDSARGLGIPQEREGYGLFLVVFCTRVGSLPEFGASPLGESRQDAGDLGSERETLGMRMGMSERKTGGGKKKNIGGGRTVVWEGKEPRHLKGKKNIQQAGKVKKAKTLGHGKI